MQLRHILHKVQLTAKTPRYFAKFAEDKKIKRLDPLRKLKKEKLIFIHIPFGFFALNLANFAVKLSKDGI